MDRITAALDVVRVGVDEGPHHKQWFIDQMVRALTGAPWNGESEEYREFVRAYEAEGLDWDEGIAP